MGTDKLVFLHLNCMNSHQVCCLLNVDLFALSYDVASINEPYLYNNIIYNFCYKYDTVYHNKEARCALLIKKVFFI